MPDGHQNPVTNAWVEEIGHGETWRMEQFSKAYLKAVASTAGCKVSWSAVDDDSVDGTLTRRSRGTAVRSPSLDVQLKATGLDCIHGDFVSHVLKLKNYDDLRDAAVGVPRVLIVVTMPASPGEWIAHSEQELALRRCGYWLSLRGLSSTTNSSSVSVQLPRAQVVDPAGIAAIFDRLQAGGTP
jgi:uncharacterized protein DUF4365